MENSTYANGTFPVFKLEIWVVTVTVSSTMFVISFYSFVALLYHKTQVENPLEEKFLKLPLNKKYAFLTKHISLFIAILSCIGNVFIFGWQIAEGMGGIYDLPWPSTIKADTFCAVVPRGLFVGYLSCCFLVIIFFWIRQRLIYVHSYFGSSINTTFVKRISFVTLAVYFAVWVAFVTFYLITVSFRPLAVSSTCTLDIGGPMPVTELIVFWTLITFLMQAVLLGLLINPVFKHSLWRSQQQTEEKARLRKTVIKAAVPASITFVLDWFFAFVLYILIEESLSAATLALPFAAHLIINLFGTIACFSCRKKLIWPWNISFCASGLSKANSTQLAAMKSFTVANNTSNVEIKSTDHSHFSI